MRQLIRVQVCSLFVWNSSLSTRSPYGDKNLMLVEILHTSKLPHAEKKPQNNFYSLIPEATNMVKMESEIYKYFSYFFHCVKYLILF